jgi:hypothetical protein
MPGKSQWPVPGPGLKFANPPCNLRAQPYNQDMGQDKEVQKLLEEGLYHYGHGETGLAVELWKQVLELDPKNEVAREYLSIELGETWSDKLGAGEKRPALEKVQVYETVKPKRNTRPEFQLAQQHLKAGKPEAAFSLFATLAEQEPENTAYISFLDLSKCALVKQFLQKAGSFDKVPVLRTSLSQLTGHKLTEEQGFILSMINGETNFEDIVYLSPVSPFITFYTLKSFLEKGLIGIKAQE